jgi:hypothetical protein
VDKHLDSGGAVIMRTSRIDKDTGRRMGHYWFITERSGGCYWSHNLRDYDDRYRANTVLLRSEVVQRIRWCAKGKKDFWAMFIRKRK